MGFFSPGGPTLKIRAVPRNLPVALSGLREGLQNGVFGSLLLDADCHPCWLPAHWILQLLRFSPRVHVELYVRLMWVTRTFFKPKTC